MTGRPSQNPPTKETFEGLTAEQWKEAFDLKVAECEEWKTEYLKNHQYTQEALAAVAKKQRRDAMRWDGAVAVYCFGDIDQPEFMLTAESVEALQAEIDKSNDLTNEVGLDPFGMNNEEAGFYVYHKTPLESLRLSEDESWKDEE